MLVPQWIAEDRRKLRQGFSAYHNPEVGGSSPLSATILSDQNRCTHLKPLRNQGFQRFYALFFKACFIDTQSQL